MDSIEFESEMERLLEQQELTKDELYRLISQNSQDIISLTSPEGILKYISPSVERLLQYKPENLIGRNYLELYHPEDIITLQQRDFKDEDICVCRKRHNNGAYVWFETALKFIRNEQGEIEKVLGVARDITERKQAEEMYQQLVEQSPDAILISVDGKLAYVNETAVNLFGANRKEELMQLEHLALVYPDNRQIELERQNLVFGQRRIAELMELKYVRLDGQILDVEVKSIPTSFNGKPAVHTIVRDVTERKKTHQFIQHSEKLRLTGQLAAGIAHELRNPLTSIKGFVQLIRNTSDYKEQYLQIMTDELNRIEAIVSEFLLLAKPQNMNYQTKNIVDIVSNVVKLLQPESILKDIYIQLQEQLDNPYILCDENQLKQVFINLIKNAIESMPHGGEINVEVTNQDENIVIQVTDQGRGIPDEQLTRIGEPFFTTKETGTGLGLSVSVSIIEAHHGSIFASSKPNEGTTFTVILPLCKLNDFLGTVEDAGSVE